jgi:hypothetical protein
LPILTFWGWTPSGASARAVLVLRRGSKGAFSGPPGRVKKLSTISTGGLGGTLLRQSGGSFTCHGLLAKPW